MVFTLNLSFVLSSKYTLVIVIVHIKMNTKLMTLTKSLLTVPHGIVPERLGVTFSLIKNRIKPMKSCVANPIYKS